MNKDTALQQCSADTMNPADSKELKCQFFSIIYCTRFNKCKQTKLKINNLLKLGFY